MANESSSDPASELATVARRAFPGVQSIKRTFTSFSNRNYRLYFIGQLLSSIGTWVSRIAQAWLVLQITNSAFALGLVGTLQFLPLTCLSLFGGVFADRFPKRRLLVVTQSVMATQSLVLALLVFSGVIQIWHIYVLAMILGFASAFDNPTRQAFVSEMVGTESLPNAIALNSSLFNTARIIGPAIGGALIAWFSISVPFFLDAVSYLAVIICLLLMRPSEFHDVPMPTHGPVLARIAEGIRYATRTPDVAVVLIIMAFIGTFGYNFTTILPLIAKYVIDTGALGFGSLLTAMGFGSLCAALSMAYMSRPSEKVLLVASVGFAVLLGLLAISHVYLLTILILIVLGFSSISFTATANSRLQLFAPGELRGRVMSIYIFLNMGTAPLGNFLIGWLGETYSVTIAVLTMASLCGIGVALGFFYLARHPHSSRAIPSTIKRPAPGD
jgi:MFS family permease